MRAMHLLLVGSSLSIMGASAVQAQEETEAGQAPTSISEATVQADQGEIVVTAQKRNQNLQDVPISISVISGEDIADAGIVRFQDLSTSIPNFTVSSNPISDTISMRGISSATQPGGEQTVGTYVDGIYRGRGIQSRFAFLDLDRIEILRGPQGTLFGKNTLAGAVNIASARPSQDFEGALEGAYNFSHEQVDLRGHLTGPLSDTLSGRIAFIYNDLGKGWVYNVATDRNMPSKRDWAVRGSLLWEPTDALTAVVRYEHGDLRQNGSAAETMVVGPSLAAAATRFNLPGVEGTLNGRTSITNAIRPIPSITDPTRVNGPTYLFNAESDEASVQIDYEFGPGVVTLLGGYSRYSFTRDQDVDFTPLPVGFVSDPENFRQLSGELRYTSDEASPFYYTIGAYYSDEQLEAEQYLVLNYAYIDAANCTAAGLAAGCSPLAPFRPGLAVTRSLDQSSKTWALFGQASYRITEELIITAGLRYGENRKDGVQAAFVTDGGTGAVVPEPRPGLFLALPTDVQPHVLSARVSNNSLLPQASIRWEAVPNVSFFASYARGNQDGGLNALNSSANIASLIYRPVKSEDFEFGVKSQFADRRITANVTFYHVDFTDLQTTQFSGSTSFFVTNAASARTKGVEVDLRIRPVDALTLTAAGAYNDFKFSEFRNAGCTSAQQATGNNGGPFANAAACSAAGGNDLSGRTNQNAPKFTLTTSAEYQQPVGAFLLTAMGELQHSSSYFAATDLDPNVRQPAYTKYNASLTFAPQDERWEIALVGRNLTNERTFFYGNDTPLFAGSFQVFVEQTRSVALRGKVRF